MEFGYCCVVNSLETKAMSKSMFEVFSKSGPLHNIACHPINITCYGPITNQLQSSILGHKTGLMSLTPFIADSASEEGPRQLGPVAIDGNFYLYGHRITLPNDGIRSQIEGSISQCRSWTGH